jgi:hypothetical protein
MSNGGCKMSAIEIVERLKQAGAILTMHSGNRIQIQAPESADCLIDQLGPHKREVIEILRARGGRIAELPHCPKCASYALYRQGGTGNFECQTCGSQDIPEVTARRVNRGTRAPQRGMSIPEPAGPHPPLEGMERGKTSG